MKKFIALTLAFVLALTLAACGGSSNTPNNSAPPATVSSHAPAQESEPTVEPNKDKTFGDLVEFDDLEIVFSNEIEWSSVENQFSDKNGMDVFLVPVTIKNIKNETHGLNMFYYTQFGSKGTQLDSVGSYFDNEIGSAGDMRSGAVQEVVMAFLYDGDGDYFVEFSMFFGNAIEVNLPIQK